MAMNAAMPQTNGARTAGMSTFSATPLQITPLDPSAASTEPMTPPTSACDDEDGMPMYQVTTFQMMAPTSPANMIGTVMVV